MFDKIQTTALLSLLLAAGAISCSETPRQLPVTEIHEVPFTATDITDEFWSPRIETNRTVTIPAALHQCDINGRFDNFAIAGGLSEGEHRGDFSFDDTDPYKVIEGASYSLAVKYDAALDARLDSIIALIAAAQEPDGYLCTCVTNKCYRLSGWWGRSRWEKINSHELYNCGHLYEAAVAHYRATGKRTLLDVALRNADLVCEVFGPDEGQKHVPSGHPIIEMGLAKLYKVTGEQRYLDMAKYFVEETGRGTDGHRLSAYSQDHMPILEQEEIVGHAVRAGYLYSGVADVAALTHDKAYFEALCRIWNNMASRKLYITGGIGSRAQGEGFGPDYELHNHQCYCETCASIANVYWNHRMFLYTGDAKYIDVLELALYNGVISGVSLKGDEFFYDNPLESMGQHERAEWFGCACCPGNVTRFVASVPSYIYATEGDDLFVNLYIQSNSEIETAGNKLRIAQTTSYPWDGNVKIAVAPEKQGRFKIHLRIPGWARTAPVPTDLYSFADGTEPYGGTVEVNGKRINDARLYNGYVVIDRDWQAGDEIAIALPMEVRRVQAHENVEDDRGKLAFMRGPVVFCLEGKDQPGGTVFDKSIARDAALETAFDEQLLGGVMTITGHATEIQRDGTTKEVEFKAIPYSTWCNRGADEMAVWIPETPELTRPTPEPTIASESMTFTVHAPIQKDAPESAARYDWAWGVNDQWEPKRSSDISKPYHYWWLKNGTEESLAYEFKRPETVSSVDVYWLDFDHYDGDFRVPEWWKLYYKDGAGKWREVKTSDAYAVEKDRYNTVRFEPVKTRGLKIVAKLQEGVSGGIIEWKVN
ncbi:MAG: glycoside hydrolase family 127 protein [Alistipes sp.]|nr:glycoside hydrolase family 127 protein [Alistipes sp.]